MISGKQFRDMIISGANNIYNQKSEVDRLNVFPVPDGDTGSNMAMTIGYAVGELERLADDTRIEKVASISSSALLRGARGNSGVILSLLFRGFSRGMQGKDTADAVCFAQSLQIGVDAAYKAVMKPTEGTILTVARISVEKAVERAGESDTKDMLEFIIETQKQVLEQTPDMLPVLKKAGVVDAGGKGLIIILEGMLQALNNKPVARMSGEESAVLNNTGVFAEGIGDDLTNEYCTEFLVIKGSEADANKLRQDLETIGNSVLCVDDDDLIKCHVHTESPDSAIKFAIIHGYLSKIKIENMLEQYMRLQADAKETAHNENYEDPPESFEYAAVDNETEFGFIAVSSGKGLKALFADLGVNSTVEGGQSMNPSTEDILAAVQSVAAKNVFVFVNNKNIILAAEQAAKLSDRNTVIIPTRSIPQGLSAMLAFDPTVSVEDNTIAMREAAEAVKSGAVTWAARDSDFDGREIKEGEILALEGGKLLFTDSDISRATVRLARRFITRNTSFITVIYGEGITASEAEAVTEQIRARAKDVEISLVDGGQPIYYYYISAE